MSDEWDPDAVERFDAREAKELTPEQATNWYAAAAKQAREDINAFCEFVMRDEQTGKPVVQAPHHIAWQRLMDEHDRLIVLAHIESGKTSQFAVARTLFELGHDPSLRFLILGNTQEPAKKIARLIKSYIERSDELHAVFPDLRPGEPWGEQTFSVSGARWAKDYSVQCAGVHGSIQGARLDRVIADDILDYENTRTAAQRKDLIDWWPVVIGRGTDNLRIRFISNAWHPQDIVHHLAKQRDVWRAFKYPVLVNGEPRWPERWPMERIIKKAAELGPIEARRLLDCEARDDSTAFFPRHAIDIALRLGDGTDLCSALTVVPRGYATFTGVDLAVQEKDTSDDTCIFTIATDRYQTRSVLSIERGKWPGPEIVRRIIDSHRRFQSAVWVENNAAQDFIKQWVLEKEAIPIRGYTTGRSKAHPQFGVPHIATEMAASKWRIPNHGGVCHPLVQQWIDEMLYYDPSSHTGDALMACFFAVEGAKHGAVRVEQVSNLGINRR